MVILTDEQRAAALKVHAPIALTAPAGSGKTSVLVARYLELLKHYPAHQILAVTFTNEAADNLRARVIEVLTGEEKSLTLIEQVENSSLIGTIHSFCLQLIRMYGPQSGLAPFESILSHFEFEVEFEQAYQNWLTKLSDTTLEQALELFGHRDLRTVVRDCYLNRELFLETVGLVDDSHPLKPVAPSIRKFVIDLNISLLKRGFYGFDDLELQARKILRNEPRVREQLQKSIQALLVDEFQDTSPNQWEILQHVLGDNIHKLFIVGDPRQSIYGFRRAEPRLFNEASARIRQSGGHALELTLNFRTAHGLLSEINRLSSSSMKPFTREGQDGVFWCLRYPSKDKAKRSELHQSELHSALDYIQKLLSENRAEQIAVLFRVGDRIAEYAAALGSRGISSVCHRTGSVFENYEVLDLYAFLKSVENPKDNYYLSAFLCSPFVGCTERDLWEKIGKHPKNTLTAPDWIVQLSETLDLDTEECLKALFKNSSHFPKNHELFQTLLTELQNTSLKEAVHRMDIWRNAGLQYEARAESSQKGISLMTVHAAKGLEFDHVLIADTLRSSPKNSAVILFHRNKAPAIRYHGQEEPLYSAHYETIRDIRRANDEAESERIFYVAMTRARKSLAILVPQNEKCLVKGSWAETLKGLIPQSI